MGQELRTPQRDSDPAARELVVVDAPSNLGLRPPSPGVEPGVRGLPDVLHDLGLVRRLGARIGGRVEPAPYSPEPEHETGFFNGPAVGSFSRGLADALAPVLARGDFVLVLGGDCSVLLGCGLALRRRDRYGLAYVDAHDDYSGPRDGASRHGRLTAAGLNLFLATGRGPEALADPEGLGPSFREEDVVHVGLSRTPEEVVDYAVESFDRSGIHAYPFEEVRNRGAAAIGGAARSRLEAMPVDGFWIHLDADVLDAALMPAVDSPNERGLRFDELEEILVALLESPRAVGLQLTILDPDLDPDRRYAAAFAAVVERAFVRSGRAPAAASGDPSQLAAGAS